MTKTSPDLIKNVQIHQKLNAKQLSYDELFHRVDKNNDGKIDVNELIERLEKLGVETSSIQRVARVSYFIPGKESKNSFSFIAYYRSRYRFIRGIISLIPTIC
jgi:hypothetical protein